MRRIIFGLLLFMAIFAQATILPKINPLTVTPDLVLVLLFMWCTFCGPREALLWIFVTGVFLDILSLDALGTNALALSCIVILAWFAQQRILQSNVIVPMMLVVVATFAHGFVLYTLRGTSLSIFILYQALFHALLVPIFYLFMRRMAREH